MLPASIQKSLLDNLATAVILLNDKIEIDYLNPAAENLFQCSLKSAEGNSLDSLFFEDAQTHKELRECLATGHPYTKREVKLQTNYNASSSKHLTVNYTVAVLENPSVEKKLLIEFQPLDRFLQISRDETLLNNQQATKALVRGMAHEVKNPLGGIRGAAQLLSKELHNPDQLEYTQVIIDEADRLRNLVDRMLGPNNLPNIEPVNIHAVLEHITNIMEAETEGKIVIHKDYDPSIPEFPLDHDMLVQAALNVIRNAWQALKENEIPEPEIILQTRVLRQFTIAAKRYPLVVRINFIDNGPGIPKDISETLFYPMISGRAKGSGLGLSIAQSIINRFDGIIEHDRKDGQTIFSFLLPLKLEKSETQES